MQAGLGSVGHAGQSRRAQAKAWAALAEPYPTRPPRALAVAGLARPLRRLPDGNTVPHKRKRQLKELTAESTIGFQDIRYCFYVFTELIDR